MRNIICVLLLIILFSGCATTGTAMKSHDTKTDIIIHEESSKFSWPPPVPTSHKVVPKKYFFENNDFDGSLSSIAKIIEKDLNSSGYSELSYYLVPKGFAITTRIEQYDIDGTSKNGKSRWNIEYEKPKVVDFISYLKALIGENKGFYRMFIYVVTNEELIYSEKEIKFEDACIFMGNGMGRLPETLWRKKFDENYDCYILMYTFVNVSENHEAIFEKTDNLSIKEHLKKTNLWRWQDE